MRRISTLLLFASLFLVTKAQYETVLFNYEKSYFNEGQPLPAENYFLVSGNAGPEVSMVSISIYGKGGKHDRTPLYSNLWKRGKGNAGSGFILPINSRLKPDGAYDIVFRYYRGLDSEEKAKLHANLDHTLDVYLEETLRRKNRRIRIGKPAGLIIAEMNGIVARATRFYKTQEDMPFEGFSDLVKIKIREMNNLHADRASVLEKTDADPNLSKSTARNQVIREHIASLKELVFSETEYFMNRGMHKQIDKRVVREYPTEKKRKIITLHAGAGGAWVTDAGNQPTIGAAPYAGVSIPVANPASQSHLLRNTSIITGVFLTNFNGPNNEVYSGPLVQRPFYVGLGYRAFYIFRINAGAVLLEDRTGAQNLINVDKLSIRPFVGLSAEINLWLGLDRD